MAIIDTDAYNELFFVLRLVFVEIRLTDKINKANILADIFHNVPAKIWAGGELETIMAEIAEKAERHECQRVIDAYFQSARNSIARASRST